MVPPPDRNTTTREFHFTEQDFQRPGAESPALQLVQQVRDEAHRFAITGHRGRRQKTRNSSRLEDIPGIGPRRRASLLKHFGGLGGLKAAGIEEISRVEGVNEALAERIYAALHGLDAPAEAPAPAGSGTTPKAAAAGRRKTRSAKAGGADAGSEQAEAADPAPDSKRSEG